MSNSPQVVQVLGAFLALCMRLAAADGSEEDWSRFLGPAGNNTSSETGLLNKWLEKGLPLVWEKQIGTGYSAPSVRHPYLVLHHRIKDQEIVEAFEATNGNPVWHYAYSSSFVDPFGYNNGPRCTPVLTSNHCYTFGADGRLVCLALQTGQLIWQRETTKDWNVPEPFFGVGSSPLLEGDKLIVMIGGQPNSGVVALDADTGKTLWENVGKTNWDGVRAIGWRGEPTYHWTGEEKLASYSSPVAATIHGRRHILCLTRQGLVSLNPTNGMIYFSRWFQSQVNESVNAMCPVLWEDLVLLSGAYYRIGSVLLRIKPDSRSFEEVWRSPKQPFEREPGSGTLMAPVLEVHWNTPVLHDGYLYAFSGRNEPDATFRCLEFKSGQLMWNRMNVGVHTAWPNHLSMAAAPLFWQTANCSCWEKEAS